MSRENVEIVRRLNRAFNENPTATEAWLRFYDPDVEFRMPPNGRRSAYIADTPASATWSNE